MTAPGEGDVSASTSSEASPKVYPAELREILERASRGDDSALPELRKALDAYPELAAKLGDLVRHAEDAVLRWATGTCLTAREAIARQAAELRARLSATAQSDLEKLLVDRVVISWLEAYTADVHLAGLMGRGGGATPAAHAAQRVLDRAHQRFLGAARTLATVQKLARPSLAPIQIASRLQGVAARSAARPAGPTLAPAGVEN
jgi:hypothetical protein